MQKCWRVQYIADHHYKIIGAPGPPGLTPMLGSSLYVVQWFNFEDYVLKLMLNACLLAKTCKTIQNSCVPVQQQGFSIVKTSNFLDILIQDVMHTRAYLHLRYIIHVMLTIFRLYVCMKICIHVSMLRTFNGTLAFLVCIDNWPSYAK
jgi:hypothetical protein